MVLLGFGALFLSMSVEYAPEIYSLLLGEVLGVAASEVAPVAALGAGPGRSAAAPGRLPRRLPGWTTRPAAAARLSAPALLDAAG